VRSLLIQINVIIIVLLKLCRYGNRQARNLVSVRPCVFVYHVRGQQFVDALAISTVDTVGVANLMFDTAVGHVMRFCLLIGCRKWMRFCLTVTLA